MDEDEQSTLNLWRNGLFLRGCPEDEKDGTYGK